MARQLLLGEMMLANAMLACAVVIEHGEHELVARDLLSLSAARACSWTSLMRLGNSEVLLLEYFAG
jgi:chorismate-pyruvate lyase